MKKKFININMIINIKEIKNKQINQDKYIHKIKNKYYIKIFQIIIIKNKNFRLKFITNYFLINKILQIFYKYVIIDFFYDQLFLFIFFIIYYYIKWTKNFFKKIKLKKYINIWINK